MGTQWTYTSLLSRSTCSNIRTHMPSLGVITKLSTDTRTQKGRPEPQGFHLGPPNWLVVVVRADRLLPCSKFTWRLHNRNRLDFIGVFKLDGVWGNTAIHFNWLHDRHPTHTPQFFMLRTPLPWFNRTTATSVDARRIGARHPPVSSLHPSAWARESGSLLRPCHHHVVQNEISVSLWPRWTPWAPLLL